MSEPLSSSTAKLFVHLCYRWRSTAVMRYADPFPVSDDLFALAQTDKRKATNQLLIEIRESLEVVSLLSPDQF